MSRIRLALLLLLGSGGCATTQAAIQPSTLPVRAPLECAPAPSDKVGLASLLEELVDLRTLARLSRAPYTSELATSFDRNSLTARPDEPNWFANRDFAKASIDPATVLIDVKGPGVVTRIWSANPSGVLRIYLDGATEPSLEAPFKSLLSGAVEPFAAPYAFEAGGGFNLYFPIAFQSGCRITVGSDAQRLYYHVDYRRYTEGTPIETYSKDALAAASCQLARTAQHLSSTQPPLPAAETFTLTVTPGQRATHDLVAAASGSVVRELRIYPSRSDPEALRGTLLELQFDGEPTVQVPLGDFFGTGPGLLPVNSQPVSVDVERGVLIARWPMPFRERARLSLSGHSSASFQARIELASEPWKWDEDSLYFGAQWHPTSWQSSKPIHDWPLIQIRGNGKYVGTLLNVLNGSKLWWGEGDEKIFVDQASFPTHFGTGSEDYFGYGWCSNVLFGTPLIGQTRADRRQNWGATSLYRFHILDAIPFTAELRFDLEVLHWGDPAVPIAYDAIGFFYARPGVRVEPRADDPGHYRVPELREGPPPGLEPSDYNCGHG
ncbi:MAG TPA: glycoside hydrolase family 172 protein [Polyangiales bacterium]|nr:glycoside hydrolase family 172 protein [Polyangiales bacterium]